MDNIIEALKQNEMAHGLMKTEEFTNKEMVAKFGEIISRESTKNILIYNLEGEWAEITHRTMQKLFTYRLREDYTEPEAEIVECVILPRMIDEDFYIQVYVFNGTAHPMHQIPDGYILVGFKFKGTKQVINKEFGYSHNDIDILPFVQYDNLKSGKDKILHATHVLFRKA